MLVFQMSTPIGQGPKFLLTLNGVAKVANEGWVIGAINILWLLLPDLYSGPFSVAHRQELHAGLESPLYFQPTSLHLAMS